MTNIKLSALPTFTPTTSDYVIGEQASGPTDGRMTVSSIRNAMMTKTTDANGWTKYDYGTWQEYRIKGSLSVTIAGIGWSTEGSIPLPASMSTIGTNFIETGVQSSDNAIRAQLGALGNNVSSLTIECGNQYSSSVTATIYYSICITTS